MAGNKSSADVRALFRYAERAQSINGSLKSEAGKLEAALKTFAATCIEYPTNAKPELAGQLRTYAQQCEPKDEKVRQVGKDFAKADAETVNKWLVGNLSTATILSQGQMALEQARQVAFHTRYSTTKKTESIPKHRWLHASYKAWRQTPKGGQIYFKTNKLGAPLAHLPVTKKGSFTKGTMPWRQIGGLTKESGRDALLPKDKWMRRLWMVQVAASGVQNWQEYKGEAGDVRAAKTTAATAFDTAVQTGINIAATAAGTAAGGALGGAVGGPIGAAIGARLGGIAGSVAGAWISEQVMKTDAVKDVREGFVNSVGGWFD
jgi:hypothetical protein